MCNIFFNGCIGREKIFSTRFLITVLYGHFNYWKYFFRRFLTLFSTVSTVENNQVSCSENTTNKKRRDRETPYFFNRSGLRERGEIVLHPGEVGTESDWVRAPLTLNKDNEIWECKRRGRKSAREHPLKIRID